MNILFLQGPNLNLLGVKSSHLEEKLTLDKLNREVRKNSKKFDLKLKILQTILLVSDQFNEITSFVLGSNLNKCSLL